MRSLAADVTEPCVSAVIKTYVVLFVEYEGLQTERIRNAKKRVSVVVAA